MGILANISAKRVIAVFLRIGFRVERQEGSHIILYSNKPDRPPLSIPNHKELAPGLLRSQIKRAGLTVDQFIKLLKKK